MKQVSRYTDAPFQLRPNETLSTERVASIIPLEGAGNDAIAAAMRLRFFATEHREDFEQIKTRHARPGYAAGILHCLFLALAIILCGCRTQGEPPWQVSEHESPRAIQVVKHGWHVGIVVDRDDMAAMAPELRADFPDVEKLEIGWGDARYYQAPDPSAGLALRAVLLPTASVLHVAGFSGDPERYFPESEVVDVCVGQSAYRRLIDFIAETFDRDGDGDVRRLGSGLYGSSRFYRAEGSFHAFNTCNTWAARAIASTGAPISSRMVFTSGGLMSQLHRDGADVFPCPDRLR